MIQLCGKATKKPVEIHWFLYKGNAVSELKELKEWVKLFNKTLEEVFEYDNSGLKVKTLEGHSYIVPNGYVIIRGVAGEFYPCDPEIFHQTYNVII